MWDAIFEGSFCPPKTGKYRIIFSGSYESYWDPLVFTLSFGGINTNQRISDYQYLESNQCYQFYILQAVAKTSGWGQVYFQEEGQPQYYANSTNSYSCRKNWCRNGMEFPNCKSNSTYEGIKLPYSLYWVFVISFLY